MTNNELNHLLSNTRAAKVALNDARDTLDNLTRRNGDDPRLCTHGQVDSAWDVVEARMAAYLTAKAAYHAACRSVICPVVWNP